MATEVLFPDGDVTAQWSPATGSDNFEMVNEDITSPVIASDYNAGLNAGEVDRYTLTAPTFTGTCTSIRVGVHGGMYDAGCTLHISIYDSGGQIGSEKTIQNSVLAYNTVWTDSWTGLSKTPADMAGLEVSITMDDPKVDNYLVATVNVELTYEEGGPGITKINIGDAWKDVTEVKINVGDAWKDVSETQINIGDAWKDTN